MAENGATLSQSPSAEEVSSVESKGKGKAAAEEAPTREVTATEGGDDDDEDDEDDEEDEDDDEVRCHQWHFNFQVTDRFKD